MMTESPILFSGPMIRAILENRKTMTRRIVKPQPEFSREFHGIEPCHYSPTGWAKTRCQNEGMRGCSCIPFACHYHIGDRLWVRETFQIVPPNTIFYRADKGNTATKGWKPSIFMSRWASRITLEITDVRVERLQEITEEDAKKEGIESLPGVNLGGPHFDNPIEVFSNLWDFINGKKYPWASSPWVWAISFRRVSKP